MSNLYNKKGKLTHSIKKFGGLERVSGLCNGDGSFELCNLRVGADGSLTRREGFYPILTLPEAIRGMTSVKRNGVTEYYAVAGDTVYSLSCEQGEWSATALATLSEDAREISFFCLDGRVLLPDGDEIWDLTPTSAAVAPSYYPVYGKNWLPNGDRSVYEEPNLLTRCVRFHFQAHDQGTNLYLPMLPEQVKWVKKNGVDVRYSLISASKVVQLGEVYRSGDIVEICGKMPVNFYPAWENPVTFLRNAAEVGNADRQRILFYGADDPGEVYVSRRPREGEDESLWKYEPTATLLYVTASDRARIGDGIHPVTGGCRHYDRTLIFTDQGCWMMKGEASVDEKTVYTLINTQYGCGIKDSVGAIANCPVSVQGNNVLLWNSETDERDECNASVISDEVTPLFPADFGSATKVFCNLPRREVWFYQPGGNGRILIYQLDEKCWTSFSGFSPDGVFQASDNVGFYTGTAVFLMDPAAVKDCGTDGVEHGISVAYQSQFLDFGAPGRNRRGCFGVISAACGAQEMVLTAEAADGRSRSVVMTGNGGDVTELSHRVFNGRFRFIRLGFTSDDAGELRVFSLNAAAVG